MVIITSCWLRSLSVAGCLEADDALLAGLGRLAVTRDLERLNLEGCPRVSDLGLLALDRLPRLHNLNLVGSGCTGAASLGEVAGMEALALSLRRQGLVPTEQAPSPGSSIEARVEARLGSSPLLTPAPRGTRLRGRSRGGGSLSGSLSGSPAGGGLGLSRSAMF